MDQEHRVDAFKANGVLNKFITGVIIVLAESLPLFGVKAPKTAPGPFFRAGEAQKAFETAGAMLGWVVGAF